ncbi:hypothetical protein NPIL_208381 [Nephila pilipes]|uniref:Uncharacterized protein n=1 Tax=Nephila pilipes TaxID=299642 RepID=A0A8X6TK42_NEPPI|nr:hypothetical protein NPIL_208381 [Nephila pilipes]
MDKNHAINSEWGIPSQSMKTGGGGGKVKVHSEQMMGIGAFPGREIHLNGERQKQSPSLQPTQCLCSRVLMAEMPLSLIHTSQRGPSTNCETLLLLGGWDL